MKKFLIILTTAALLTSCFKKEDFDLGMIAGQQDIDYDIAAPLFETKFTVDDLLFQLKSANVQTDGEGLVHFIFPEQSFVNLWDNINLTIPGSTSISIGNIPYFQYDTTISYTYSDTMSFSIDQNNGGDISVDSVVFTKIDINCAVSSTVDAELKMRIVFPTLINRSTGMPASQEITVPNGNPYSASSSNQSIALTNVRWNAASFLGYSNNYKVPVIITLTADLRTANSARNDGSLNTVVSFGEFDYSRFYGNIGNTEHSFDASIAAEGFLEIPVDELILHQFFLNSNITLTNLSIPVKVKSNNIGVITNTNERINLSPLFNETNNIIEYPLPTDVPFEKTTHAHQDILEGLHGMGLEINKAKEFFGEFKIETNPVDAVPSQNVLEKGAKVTLGFDVDLPVDLEMMNYHLSDTMPFDMFTPDQINLLHSFNLKMILINAFPIDADIIVQFLDENQDTVLTVYNGHIEGAEIGADFHVVKPAAPTTIEIDLLAGEMEKLKRVRSIFYAATFDTQNSGRVQIFAGSDKEGYMSFKAGVRAKLKAGVLMEDFVK